MTDHPDFYTDGVAVSVGPFGITITFQLSQPSTEVGPHVDPNEIVGRVRMSVALARVIGQALLDAAAQQPPRPRPWATARRTNLRSPCVTAAAYWTSRIGASSIEPLPRDPGS